MWSERKGLRIEIVVVNSSKLRLKVLKAGTRNDDPSPGELKILKSTIEPFQFRWHVKLRAHVEQAPPQEVPDDEHIMSDEQGGDDPFPPQDIPEDDDILSNENWRQAISATISDPL